MKHKKRVKTAKKSSAKKKKVSQNKEHTDKLHNVVSQYEEVIINCANCGKEMKIIKVSGYSTEGMLCQKCGFGEEKMDWN